MGGTCNTRIGGDEKCIQSLNRKTRSEETTWKTRVYVEDNIKTDPTDTGCVVVGWMHVAPDRVQ
jgi:hypothetical protein